MKGLLIKDSLILMKQMKLFLILIPILAFTGDASMAAIAILTGAALPMTSMAYDEQSKWEELALMMPYSKKDIVLCKYILGYLGMAGASVIFIIIQLIITNIWQENFEKSIYMVLFALINGMLLIAVNTPILFRFGTQKGRFVFIFFIGFSVAIGTFLKNIMPNITMHIDSIAPILVIVAVLILNILSVFISLRFKQS